MAARIIIILFPLLVLWQPVPGSEPSDNQAPSSVKQVSECSGQLENARIRIQRLEKELGAVSGKYEQELSALKNQLQSMQTAAEELRRARDSALEQRDKLSKETVSLRSENDQLKASAGTLNLQLQSKQKQLDIVQAQHDKLSGEVGSLRSENDQLKAAAGALTLQLREKQGQIDSAQAQLKSNIAELEASKRTNAEVSQRLNAFSTQLRDNPHALIQSIKASQATPETAPPATVYQEAGRTVVVRDLVIGILKLDYDKEAEPGRKSTVNATFTPHPILKPGFISNATEKKISWYLRLDYVPERSQANYDQQRSGQKAQERELNVVGNDEVWTWDVIAPKGFQVDKSPVTVYAGYTTEDEPAGKPAYDDIARQTVEFTEKSVPGWFSRAFSFFKEYLAYFLASATAILGFWTAYFGIKKSRVEVRLAELKLQLEASGSH